MSKITISAIVASAKNRVIGDGEQLFWKISEDFRRLKEITMGCPLIMGRKTWDSIGKPLPGRASIVLTRNPKWHKNGAIKASSIEEGISIGTNWLKNNGMVKFMGGHCTGIHAATKMAEIIGIQRENLSHTAIGSVLTKDLTIIRSSVE